MNELFIINIFVEEGTNSIIGRYPSERVKYVSGCLALHIIIRELLKQGLDWDWNGTGLGLDWSWTGAF